MLVQRFPYIKLTRANVNGSRMYACPGDLKLPSVTTVLSATKPEKDKKTLNEWKKRVGHQKAAAITQEAASRGTRMHAFLETYMKDGATGEPGTNPFSKQSHSMAQHIIAEGLKNTTEFYGCEINLYFPGLYAGTTDCVALYENDLCIIDFKQANKIKREEWLEDYRMQLVSYAHCHNELFGTKIQRCINMICTPDLQFQKFEVTPQTFDHYSNLWWDRLSKFYDTGISFCENE